MPMTPEELDRLLRKSVTLFRDGSEPLHHQLTRALRRLIVHSFQAGEAFYPEEMLSQRLNVSVGTVRRSLICLTEEGLLERHRGQGSFVRQNVPLRGRGFHVKVVLNTFDSFFNRTVLREISFLCQMRGYSLDISNPSQDWRTSNILDSLVVPQGGLGLVLLSLDNDLSYDLCRGAELRGIPFANVDTRVPGFESTEVKVENRRGIELGMEYLKQLGHRRVALLLSEDPLHVNIVERVTAFETYVSAHSMDGSIVEFAPDPTFENRSHAMVISTEDRYDKRINAEVAEQVRNTDATAVFCVSDIGACLLMKQLQIAGVRIPEEMSVMGFNDEGICRLVHPELTTIAQPYADMAARVINMLETPLSFPQDLQFTPRLVIRESTGPVVLS